MPMDRRTFLATAAAAALAPIEALAAPEPHLLQMGGYPLAVRADEGGAGEVTAVSS